MLKRFHAQKEKEYVYSFKLFGRGINNESDPRTLKLGEGEICFNLTTNRGAIMSGMGISNFAMPESETDLENDVVIPIRGNKVFNLWKLKWYNKHDDCNRYYLFYFNDEGYACYDDLFQERWMTVVIQTGFTSTPYATYYRVGEEDGILLSGEGDSLVVVTGSNYQRVENAPKIINCCSHYGKFFAITADTRGSLIYVEDSNVLQWSDEKTKNLDFSDERGDLNKIISFNDYLYIFRDFGITEISEYGNDAEFSISHIYQSSAHIAPNSIAQSGDKIYFLEGSAIKSFNGNSVKEVQLNCLDILKGQNQSRAYGVCLDGKYYLACRGNFGDEQKIGCEASESGYINNILLCLDIQSGKVEMLRGVDINEMVALTNKYKSKIAICFNNENIGKIGQITNDGKLFGENLYGVWQSGTTDFEKPLQVKNIKKFSIQSSGDVEVVISSDKTQKRFKVQGSDKIQEFVVNLSGRQFSFRIESQGGENVDIGEFSLAVCFKK
ncbi:MAG: hypothetical protein J6C53_00540 [Clostridia bacterium]|nr:hypothetical protein [Clostridia bacterium]